MTPDEMALTRTTHGPYTDMPTHECGCYPRSRGYPASLARGCSSPSQCWVLDELREGATPEGRAKYRARYMAQLAERFNQGATERDVTPQMLRAGCPSIAVSDAKNPPQPPSEAMLAARSWWSKPRAMAPALVLAGAKGIGKTTAAAWAVRQWSQSFDWSAGATGTNQQPLVWLGPESMRHIGRNDAQAAEICDRASRSSLLVVDDAGHDGSRPGIEALCDVMHERCDRGRALILTTNMTSRLFVARYGEPLADRLRACAVAPVLRDKVSLRKPWEKR